MDLQGVFQAVLALLIVFWPLWAIAYLLIRWGIGRLPSVMRRRRQSGTLRRRSVFKTAWRRAISVDRRGRFSRAGRGFHN